MLIVGGIVLLVVDRMQLTRATLTSWTIRCRSPHDRPFPVPGDDPRRVALGRHDRRRACCWAPTSARRPSSRSFSPCRPWSAPSPTTSTRTGRSSASSDVANIAIGFVTAFIAGVFVVRYLLDYRQPPRLRAVRLVAHHRRRHGLGAMLVLGMSTWLARSAPDRVGSASQAACEANGCVQRAAYSAGPVASRRIAALSIGRGSRTSARDAGQRLQMVAAGVIGRQQQEDQIDRLAVERFEIDRLLQPRKQADDAWQAASSDVRNRDAAAQRPSSPGVRAAAACRRSRGASSPVISAAFVASSCRACFLLVAFRTGMIASGASRSPRSIGFLNHRSGTVGEAPAPRAPRRCAKGRRSRNQLNARAPAHDPPCP